MNALILTFDILLASAFIALTVRSTEHLKHLAIRQTPSSLRYTCIWLTQSSYSLPALLGASGLLSTLVLWMNLLIAGLVLLPCLLTLSLVLYVRFHDQELPQAVKLS